MHVNIPVSRNVDTYLFIFWGFWKWLVQASKQHVSSHVPLVKVCSRSPPKYKENLQQSTPKRVLVWQVLTAYNESSNLVSLTLYIVVTCSQVFSASNFLTACSLSYCKWSKTGGGNEVCNMRSVNQAIHQTYSYLTSSRSEWYPCREGTACLHKKYQQITFNHAFRSTPCYGCSWNTYSIYQDNMIWHCKYVHYVGISHHTLGSKYIVCITIRTDN